MLKSAIVVLAVLFGTAISATAFDSNSYITAEAKKVTLNVPKMTWGGCVGKVKRALSKVEGVKFIEGSNKTRKVVIEVTDEAKVAVAIKAIKDGTKWDATVVGKK